MGFRRYPEKITYPCTPFVEVMPRMVELEDGSRSVSLEERDLNNYQFPEGIRDSCDLETQLAAKVPLQEVPSTLIEGDWSSISDVDGQDFFGSEQSKLNNNKEN